MNNRCLLLIIVILGALGLNAQEKKFEELKPESGWSEGSILLTNGTEKKGLVQYNDNTGILQYQFGDQSASYTPRTVSGFEFFDEIAQKQRVYYTLEYEDTKHNILRPLFFELIRDFQTFAVLSKVDPVEISEHLDAPGAYVTPSSRILKRDNVTTEIRQTETIYFLNTAGKVEPYVKVISKVVDRVWFDGSTKKNKTIDETVPLRYFSKEEYDMLKKYAKDNKLDFEVKDDLLKILEYYSQHRAKR